MTKKLYERSSTLMYTLQKLVHCDYINMSIAEWLEVLLERPRVSVSVRNLVSAGFLFTVNGSRGKMKSKLKGQKENFGG